MNKRHLIQVTTVRVREEYGERRALNPAAGEGYRGERFHKLGEIIADRFTVEIDAEALVRALGRKALKSKHRITKLQGGAVRIYPTDARRLPVGPVLDDELKTERS